MPDKFLGQVIRTTTDAYRRGKAEREAGEARRRRAEQRRELLKANADLHGSAGWSSVAELRESGLLGRADEIGQIAPRIPLGPLAVWNGRAAPEDAPHPLHYVFWNADRPGHFLTIGGTRSGKEVSQIIPTLLHYPGSCLVVDPKGESFEKTAGWRHLQGSRIIRIAPFDKNGITDAFNPLDYVHKEADARALAQILIPRTAEKDAGRFFENEAVNFVTGVILYVKTYSSAYRQNIAEVRLYTTPRPRDRLVAHLERMANSEIPVISVAGRLALERATAGGNRGDRLLELFRSMDAEMAVWSDEGLQRATARSDFDLRDLKRDIVTVYLVFDFELMETHGAFLRMFFTQAANALGNGEIPVPVLFLIDEFPAMGPMPAIVHNLSYLYGHGARVWFFSQTLAQIQRTYPNHWREILETAALKLYLNVKEPLTHEISRDLGSRTVAFDSMGTSDSLNQTADGGGTSGESASRGLHFAARPLLTADELSRWLNRKRPEENLNHLGLLTLAMADDRRFCVNRPFWFMDANMREMVERGMAHLVGCDKAALKKVYRPA